jgi:Uncharacterized protein conserved in bacteria (DUF2188)
VGDVASLEKEGSVATPAIRTVPSEGGWANKPAGSDDVLSRHETKGDAVEAGRAQARQDRAEHIIHEQDGTIGERNRYGSDPTSSAG